MPEFRRYTYWKFNDLGYPKINFVQVHALHFKEIRCLFLHKSPRMPTTQLDCEYGCICDIASDVTHWNMFASSIFAQLWSPSRTFAFVTSIKTLYCQQIMTKSDHFNCDPSTLPHSTSSVSTKLKCYVVEAPARQQRVTIDV